jgi:hypothetical protein
VQPEVIPRGERRGVCRELCPQQLVQIRDNRTGPGHCKNGPFPIQVLAHLDPVIGIDLLNLELLENRGLHHSMQRVGIARYTRRIAGKRRLRQLNPQGTGTQGQEQ